MLVQVSDEVIGGEAHVWQLNLAKEQLTVRELIRSRVYQEVQDANLKRRNHLLLSIDRLQTEATQLSEKSIGALDWTCHYEQAITAYTKGRFLLLVDDYQTESLDEVVELKQVSQVTFLKLFPLVGG